MSILRRDKPSAPARSQSTGLAGLGTLEPPAGSPAAPSAAGTSAEPATATRPAAAAPSPELTRRRDALAQQVAELHWDLGGLAYEMAIRDHFRLDVLVRRAALLQERDAELAEVERMLRMEEGGVAGSCSNCGAPHSRGAAFCWQCGGSLMQRLPSASTLPDADTQMMDALLESGTLPGRTPGGVAPGQWAPGERSE